MNLTTASASAKIKVLFAALAFGLALALFAAEPEIPELTGRVVDTAGMLSGDGAARVEQAIKKLEESTGGQMAVLTIPTLNGMDIESYGIKTAEKWKIGYKGKDNGAILIISKAEHKTRLEVGYGWEGLINDARAGDILRQMTPYFKADDFAGGMVYAVTYVEVYITGKAPSLPVAERDGNGVSSGIANILILLAVLCIPVFIFILKYCIWHWTYGTYGGGSGSDDVFGGGGGSSSDGGGFSGGGGGGFGGGGASGGW
mgnify:CR=1 FL=1